MGVGGGVCLQRSYAGNAALLMVLVVSGHAPYGVVG